MATTQFLQQAYMAYFGRPVDATGARDFANASEADVAAAFSASPESIALFGPTFNASQVNFIYLLLFGRPAEPEGIEYWVNQVTGNLAMNPATGKPFLTAAEAAVAILRGALNEDAIAVSNKLAASALFSQTLTSSGEDSKYVGDAAAAAARDFIRTVNTTVPDASTISDAVSAVVAINTPVAFTLAVDSPSITEGDSGSKVMTFTLTLDKAPSTAVTVNFNSLTTGTATAGDDFTPADGTVTFAVGQTVATASITVLGDTDIEANETIAVLFSGSSLNADVTATGTITNNDVNTTQSFTLTSTAPSIVEGDTGTKNLTFTLTLDKAPTSAVTVNYQTLTTGTASSGDDFNADAGTVTFAIGQTVASVNVVVNGDTVVEPDETVAVLFSGSSLNASFTATGTITNNDVNTTQSFTLTSTAPSIVEGDTGTKNLTFTLTLDKAPTSAVTVNYQTLTTGTASSGDDFNADAGTVTFAIGQTVASVNVVVNGDTVVEPDETVAVRFSGSSLNADVTATGTITNDDVNTTQSFNLTANTPTVVEGDTGTKNLTFTLTLDKSPTSAVTVNYQTLTTGTATSGDDFNTDAGTVTFAIGQTVASVNVVVNGDTVFETDETVAVSFSGSSLNASVTATGTITNNDIEISNPSQVFTLTTGTDTIPGLIGSNSTNGTTGNDTVTATLQNSGTNGATDLSTLNGADSLNTGAGTDVINIRVASLTGPATVAPTLTNLEKVSISNITTDSQQVTVDLVFSTGMTAVEFKDTTTASFTFVTNVPSGATVSLDNADSINNGGPNGHFVNIASASARTGSADAVAIAIGNGSGSELVPTGLDFVNADLSAFDTSFEVANITVAGAASFLNVGNWASTLTTINVVGETTGVTDGFGLTLSSVTSPGNFPNLLTVDASGMTGGGLNIDAREAANVGFSFTGSASNDRIVLSIDDAAKLDGGAGTGDILGTTTFFPNAALVNQTTGFEILEAVGPESNLVASDYTINEFLFSGGPVNGRLDISGVEDDDLFVFASDQGSSDEAVRFIAANAGNSVTFEMRASPESGGEVTITGQESGSDVSAVGFQNSISSVNIRSTGENSEANSIKAVQGGSHLAFALNNDSGLAIFVITGSHDLTIGAQEGVVMSSSSKTMGFQNSANVNASNFTGNLHIAGSMSNDVMVGGSGNDIFYGLGGSDTLTGHGGSDQFRMVGTSGTDLIKDFTQGTDKIGINNVDFEGTNATFQGVALATTDYIENRTSISQLNNGSDNRKVIELQSALSTSQIQTDLAASSVDAYLLVFNSTTNKAELWYDPDWSDSGRNQVATFDNITDIAGLIGFKNTDFVEFSV